MGHVQGARQGEQPAAGSSLFGLWLQCDWDLLLQEWERGNPRIWQRALSLIQIPFTQNLSSSINPSNSMSQHCLLWPFSLEPPRPLWYFPCLFQSPFPAPEHSYSISTPLLPFYPSPNTSKYCNSSNSLKHLRNLCTSRTVWKKNGRKTEACWDKGVKKNHNKCHLHYQEFQVVHSAVPECPAHHYRVTSKLLQAQGRNTRSLTINLKQIKDNIHSKYDCLELSVFCVMLVLRNTHLRLYCSN